MGQYDQLAKEIVDMIGGNENVESLTHCITRLRFKLKDTNKAKTEDLKKVKGIVTVVQSAGQYQVVIGTHVADVYADVLNVSNIKNKNVEKFKPYTFNEKSKIYFDKWNYAFNSPRTFGKTTKKNFNFLIDLISGIFQPILGVLIATGVLKGIVAILVATGAVSDVEGSSTYGSFAVLNALSDSVFYFMPVMLGFTSAKKFGASTFLGVVIGLTMVYPTIVGLTEPSEDASPIFIIFEGSFLETKVYHLLFGIPLISINYATSVLPVIFATYFAYLLEKGLKKIIPNVIRSFSVPIITFIIIIPIALLAIGPVITWASLIMSEAIQSVYGFSAILAGLIVGFLWQFLVIFGIHWAFIPIIFINLNTYGYDQLSALILSASFTQTAVVFGILTKTRDKELRDLCIPAAISGIFGVTEPIIYGITLPRPKLFFLGCVGAAIGGAIAGGLGEKVFVMGGLGIFEFLSKIDPVTKDITNVYYGLIQVGISMVFTYSLTLVFFSENKNNFIDKKINIASNWMKLQFNKVNEWFIKDVLKKKINPNLHQIATPITGKVIQLTNVNDETFAKGGLGKGIAIEPNSGNVYSPCDGQVAMLFPTKHAFAIKSTTGEEVLIHIGIDTVKLDGKYFQSYVKEGDKVKKNELLMKFDKDAIKKLGYDLTTPIVITNSNDYKEIKIIPKKSLVTRKQELIETIKV